MGLNLLKTGWGSHSDDASTPYLTAAAAIGMQSQEIHLFAKKLDKVLTDMAKNKKSKKTDQNSDNKEN